MKKNRLADSTLEVTDLCLGTMTWGEQNTEAEAHAQIERALAHGINFIDTAEMYPVPPRRETQGTTERFVGSWIARNRGRRGDFVLASKIAGPGRRDWIRDGDTRVSARTIPWAIDDSLRRLQTDYIDLYQVHWPERNVPMFGQYQFDPMAEYDDGIKRQWVSIREQLEALAELVQAGKIRYIGVSNEHAWGVMEFLRIAGEYHLPRIVSIQNCYNLINRGYEFGLAEISYREQLSLLAYSPLAFGHLTGKYLEGGSGRATLFRGFAQRYEKPNVAPASAAYAALAREYGFSPAELALSFVYHRWFVASTIIGATSMRQLQENFNAWKKPLSTELLQKIEQLHLRYMNTAP